MIQFYSNSATNLYRVRRVAPQHGDPQITVTSLHPMSGCGLMTYLLVRHAVIVEVRAGRKALATRGTFVRFFAGVNSSMSVK